MDVRMPDGTIIKNVPENVTQEELLEMYSQGQATEKKGFSASKMISNIPSSAAGMVQDIATAIANPIDTMSNLGNLGMGVFSKLVSGNLPEEKYAEAAGQMLKNRYGSGEAALRTLETDPVGMLSDVAGIASGGGALVSKVPKLGAAGNAMAKAGATIDPLLAAKNAVVYGASKAIPKDLPASMYESAAKFSTTLSPQERSALVQTALTEQIAPTAAGVDKAQKLINQLDTQVTNLIQDATDQGSKIPRSEVFKFVNETRKKLGGFKIESAKDKATIDSILTGYVQELNKGKKKDFTPTEMQAIKRDIYKRINFDRELMTNPSIAKEELYKSLGQGMRQGIENVVPEVGPLNAREGRLIELMTPLQRSAARIENRDLVGIGAPMKVGTGSAIGGAPGAALGAFQSLIDNPKIKSNLALRLELLKNKSPNMFLENSPSTAAMLNLFRAGGAYNQGLLE